MKELSQYYKMEQMASFDNKTKHGQGGMDGLQNPENADLKNMFVAITSEKTPFNYEPYVWRAASETMRYGSILATELKTPNTNYR